MTSDTISTLLVSKNGFKSVLAVLYARVQSLLKRYSEWPSCIRPSYKGMRRAAVKKIMLHRDSLVEEDLRSLPPRRFPSQRIAARITL